MNIYIVPKLIHISILLKDLFKFNYRNARSSLTCITKPDFFNRAVIPQILLNSLSQSPCTFSVNNRNPWIPGQKSIIHILFDFMQCFLVPLPAKIHDFISFSDAIDLTRPQTTITGGPSAKTTSRSARLSFTANEPATFRCRLDGGPLQPCTSPRTYGNLSLGNHTFSVVATDLTGNVDLTPATRSWRIVKIARLSKLKIKPRALFAAPHGPAIESRKFGATLSYVMSADANVKFRVRRRVRRHGHTRWVLLKGKFSHRSTAGLNRLHFNGRLRGRRLKPGRYRLIAKPVPGPRKHASKTARFRIKRP